MKITATENTSLNILLGEGLGNMQHNTASGCSPFEDAAHPLSFLSLGQDLSGLKNVHTLDPARVAELIADPFA